MDAIKNIIVKLIFSSIIYAIILTSFCKSVDVHWVSKIHQDVIPGQTVETSESVEPTESFSFFDGLCYSMSNLMLVSHANLTPKSPEARLITLTMPVVTLMLIKDTDLQLIDF